MSPLGRPAADLRRRELYFADELGSVPGLSAEARECLLAVAAVPEFSYVDKSTGRSVPPRAGRGLPIGAADRASRGRQN
jgi:hypothetical protein